MNRIALLLLTIFVALSAAFGGIALIIEADLGLSTSLLSGTPFASFVVPGYILLIGVGGSSTLAAVLLMIDHPQASSFAFLAGAVLTVWIAVQVVMIGMISILQPAMFTLGLMTMGFAYRHWLATMSEAGYAP
jgi:hypothetical protein